MNRVLIESQPASGKSAVKTTVHFVYAEKTETFSIIHNLCLLYIPTSLKTFYSNAFFVSEIVYCCVSQSDPWCETNKKINLQTVPNQVKLT